MKQVLRQGNGSSEHGPGNWTETDKTVVDSPSPNKPKANGELGRPVDEVSHLARTTFDPKPADEDLYHGLHATRIIDPATDSPELTPPGGIPVPSNLPIVGRTLGEFEILEKLGEGAMGAVYRAKQTSFNRVVALKILFAHIAQQPRLVERLYREGRALAQLDHPNIVQAYGVGEILGSHFIAMEYVEGNNLQWWLRRLGKLSVGDAVLLTLTIARALEHAHQLGIIHRDIKPENILIGPGGAVKVADLGMVKTEDEDMALTQTGHAIGTPWYMPLEQARNAKDTDARSDIYSLGCQLYCLLTGQPPFRGRTLVEVIQAKERGTFATARSQNIDVPERLDLVLLKMIAKSPAQRYQNCGELIRDLEKLNLAGSRLSFLTPAVDDAQLTTPRPQGTKTVLDVSETDTNIWYIKTPSSPGKHSIRKVTTEQLRGLLDSGKIKPTVPASHYPKQGFRALSTYKQFGAALSKVTRDAADETTSKYRQLYKKIEENEQSREESNRERMEAASSPWTYYLEILWDYGKYVLVAGAILGFLYYVASGLMP